MRSVIGWDVGGAHLKAARAETAASSMRSSLPRRCAWASTAWRRPSPKRRRGWAWPSFTPSPTGELADTFFSRRRGRALSALAVRELAPAEVALYAGRAGFIAPRDARDTSRTSRRPTGSPAPRSPRACSARRCSWTSARPPPTWCRSSTAPSPRALLHRAERLAAGELVYTGLVRSFVMAWPSAHRSPAAGRR